MSNAGRVTVSLGNRIRANKIQYNDISYAGLLADDLGMVYGPDTDGQNTEISYNLVHDNKAHSTKPGIYLDAYTNNFIVHHNVLWNNAGIQLNIPSNYNLVYNNTAWTNAWPVQAAAAPAFTTDMYGDRLFNNIIKGYDAESGAYTVHGYDVTSAPGFVDEALRDYRLLTTSPAKDAGLVIPGITDGYDGSAPDIGALEYGGTDWTTSVGHDFANPPSPIYSQVVTPFMNRAVNGGFEAGDLTGWTTTDAGNAVVVPDEHWRKTAAEGMSRSHDFGTKLSGGVDGVAQVVSGLQPNTNYIAGGWLRTPAGVSVALGVRDFGGVEKSTSSSSSTWTFVKVPFRTGPASTSATIFFKKTSASGEAYVDDAGVVLDGTQYQAVNGFDGFEAGLASWSTALGTATRSTVQSHSGTQSYVIDQDKDAIQQVFAEPQNKIVSLWFYDNAAATSMQVGAVVDSQASPRGIFVNTPTSTTKYSYRVGGTYAASSVTRTTGWHEFKWDYSSGAKVDMYIDGVLVASPTGVTAFNRIQLGDLWAGSTNTSYFDDVSISDPPVFTDGFEGGAGAWATVIGAPTTSTAQAHTGASSYVVDQDQDAIKKTFTTPQNKVVSMWFYDNAAASNVLVGGFVDDGVNVRGIVVNTATSATKYSYRVGGTHTATTVTRTTGWHEFKWDYTSGTKVDMYIDGVLVASPTGATSFNKVQIGDLWSGNPATTSYFDDVTVQ